MTKTFYDPFTNDGTAIDGDLVPRGSSPWDGYTYKDARGETWTLSPLTKDADGKPVVPMGGIIQTLLQAKTKPDQWRATLPPNQNANPPHQSIALYSATLVSTLEDIDNAAYALKVNTSKGDGAGWLLLLVAVMALWKGKRR